MFLYSTFTRLHLLQAEVLCRAGQPSLAAQPLLSCITLCKNHHFRYLLALATVYQAFVQVGYHIIFF